LDGVRGLLDSLLGIIVPFLLLIVLYAWGLIILIINRNGKERLMHLFNYLFFSHSAYSLTPILKIRTGVMVFFVEVMLKMK